MVLTGYAIGAGLAYLAARFFGNRPAPTAPAAAPDPAPDSPKEPPAYYGGYGGGAYGGAVPTGQAPVVTGSSEFLAEQKRLEGEALMRQVMLSSGTQYQGVQLADVGAAYAAQPLIQAVIAATPEEKTAYAAAMLNHWSSLGK